MTAGSERFQRLQSLFEQARVLPPEQRDEVVRTGCAGDEGLLRQLVVMLDHHDAAQSCEDDELLDAASALRSEIVSCDAASAEDGAQDAPLPENVGRYRIRGEIARGGFGIVLRGEDVTIGRDVAVKILPPGTDVDPRMAGLLRAEGRIGGKLQHPAIVPVYELGDDDADRPFVAMKVIEGRTLASLLRERAHVTADRARYLGIFEQVCQAVAYAHARGVVHRDLKPQNLMIGAFGEVQVMDWGLAEVLADRDASDAGSVPVIGTPAYMAPEQARGEARALNERCDVFGLGAILCEILTGAPPFAGVGTGTALEQSRAGDLGDATSRVSSCGADAELKSLVLRCLAGDPDDRPADAREVALEIRSYLDSLDERAHTAELEAAAALARASAERKARRLTTTLGVVAVLVTLIGTGTWIALESAAAQRARVASSRLRSALLDAERVAADAQAERPETSVRWTAAEAAASTAERLAISDADPELRDQVRSLNDRIDARLRDVRFAENLEAIALEDRFLSTFDRRAELAAYRDAFETYFGSDLDSIPAGRASAALARFAFPDRLLRTLDIWAITERQVDRDSPRATWLRQLAGDLDDDPWRAAVRDAATDLDLTALEALAGSDAIERATSGALLSLALELFFGERPGASLSVLERAHERFPNDFEINVNLAIVHYDESDWEESLPFAMAAMVLRPESALTHGLLAAVLSQLDRHDGATRHARRAIDLAPADFGPSTMAAEVLLRAGRLDEAGEIAARFGDTTPTNHATFPGLATLLGDVRLARGDVLEAVEWYRRAVSSPVCTPLTPRWRFSWTNAGDVEAELRAALAAQLRRADDNEPANRYLLARLDERAGRWQDALGHYERVEELRPGFARTRSHIGRLRNALGRGLVTHRTIDEAIARLDESVTYDESRAAIIGERRLPEPDPTPLRAYAEARLLQRSGRVAEAIEWFERALDADRQEPAPWVGLHAAWSTLGGQERADEEIRRRLAAGPLPDRRLDVPPAAPTPVAPSTGAVVRTPFALEVTGFAVADSRRRHGRTLWQVRAVDADYDRRPTIDVMGPPEMTLSVPTGALERGRRYAWRAAFVTGEPAIASAWSSETFFRVSDDDARAIRVDLSAWLTDDVIANPGDTTWDPFDPPNSFQLVVEGFDGERTDAGDVQGVPADGRVGVHRLAPYDGPNSIRLERRGRPLRIALPEGHHAALLALVAGANGNSIVPGSVVYDDGTVDRVRLPIVDWFATGKSDAVGPGTVGTSILRGMDRMDRDGVEERNGASLFQVYLACDPGRRAVALVLEPGAGRYDSLTTSSHLLALTVMSAAGSGAERGR